MYVCVFSFLWSAVELDMQFKSVSYVCVSVCVCVCVCVCVLYVSYLCECV
jgi:hypothetical protein